MTRDPLAGLLPDHPRLMATRGNIDRTRRAIADPNGTNPEGPRIKRKVVDAAIAALTARLPLRQPPEPDRTFLNEARDVLARFQALAMAWFIDSNDALYLKRIKDELTVVCGFYDWNPGHFLDTAEMTHAVAIAYDWFYDLLSPAERDMCVRAIMEKSLRRGYEQLVGLPKPAGWPTQSTNWNIVCNAGLMIGALAIVQEAKDPLPKTVFQRCLESVPTGFRSCSPDGAWDEGPSYWAYATEYAVYLLTSLKTALGHDFGLADLPGFYEGGHFRMHAEGAAVSPSQRRKFFNFSDCEEERRGSWCLRWLSDHCQEPKFNWMAHKDRQAKPMDLFWYFPLLPDSGNGLALNKLFGGRANVAMLRGAWGTKAKKDFRPWNIGPTQDELFLGVRAGANSRENMHGHLDLGSFVFDALQVRWAADLAPVDGDYLLPGYFDIEQGRRFRYYRTSTAGHNTLLVNGFNQPLGIETEIVGFGETTGLAVAVLDLTDAYPDCIRVRRGFALIDQRHVLIVDELTPKTDITVAWQMHTAAKASPGRMVRLENRINPALEYFVHLLEPATGEFAIKEAKGSLPGEAPSPDMEKLVAMWTGVADPLFRISVLLSANRTPMTKFPEPLDGPLWHWINWAGKHPLRSV